VEQSNGDYLVTNPDNPYVYTSRKYSNIELYLRGLVPPEAVAPMRFAIGASAFDLMPGKTILPASATTLVTIDDIIRVYGVRTPTFADSQKSFRAIWLCLSETPMTAAEMALMNRIAIYYASDAPGQEIDTLGLFPLRSMPSFKAATNGAGTLTTVLPPLK
jgi:hypothetical protein